MSPYDRTSIQSIGSTSSSLLQRAQTHDPEAWRRLVHVYGPLVDFWIHQTGLQAADVSDIFQEVFQAVARRIGTFDKAQAGGTFRGWLRIITRSKVADFFRQRKDAAARGGSDALRQFHEIPETTSGTEDQQAVGQLQLRALELVRAEFEDRTWQMFWSVTVDERTPSEVAAEMHVTPAAVRLAKSRVLRRLREELGGLEE